MRGGLNPQPVNHPSEQSIRTTHCWQCVKSARADQSSTIQSNTRAGTRSRVGIPRILDFSRRSDFFRASKFLTIASPLHNAFLRCLQPRGAIVLDPVPACDKLGSSRIDDRHELLPGDRRSPSTTVVTIGGERHLLGPAPVLSRLSCFIAMSSYGGDALIAFLCTQLDQHGHRVRGAKRPVCAVFDISGYMRCCAYLRERDF